MNYMIATLGCKVNQFETQAMEARLQEHDHPGRVEGDIAAFPQTLGGVADARLGHAQLLRHVDGADIAALLLEHEHRFQIVFRGLVNVHYQHLPRYHLLLRYH